MEDPLPEETMEQLDSAKERSPRSAGGDIRHLGALQCSRCLIPFANSKFQQRHMKHEHPADFVAQKLQGALFTCFTCPLLPLLQGPDPPLAQPQSCYQALPDGCTHHCPDHLPLP